MIEIRICLSFFVVLSRYFGIRKHLMHWQKLGRYSVCSQKGALKCFRKLYSLEYSLNIPTGLSVWHTYLQFQGVDVYDTCEKMLGIYTFFGIRSRDLFIFRLHHHLDTQPFRQAPAIPVGSPRSSTLMLQCGKVGISQALACLRRVVWVETGGYPVVGWGKCVVFWGGWQVFFFWVG